MASELQHFVREALAKGADRKAIKEQLHAAGWPADEVATALSSWADTTFPVPVPRRKPYLSAREAFLYLVMFLTLYISAISMGTLLFQFTNHWVPDPLLPYEYGAYEGQTSLIRGATASLIIAFPVFFFVATVLRKTLKRDPEKRGSKVRKWLTYVTLFVAAGVIIGDLITLVTNVLAGELTLRFILKILSILLIAGTGFGYYLWDLRSEERETTV